VKYICYIEKKRKELLGERVAEEGGFWWFTVGRLVRRERKQF
jgi:hypothetical protein